jgi:hypothetical protein
VNSRKVRDPTLSDYLQRLKLEGLSLIILKGGQPLFTSNEAGLRPLFDAINCLGLSLLEDAIVIDKLVGKAAALLISYFKAKEVHCIVLSMTAKDVLERHGIQHDWETLTPTIHNRMGTGLCPFEKAVMDVEDPRTGYERVGSTLKSLGILTNGDDR